jgi:hypothetical protein
MSDDLSAKILEELAALRRTTESLEAKQEELRVSLRSEIRQSGEELRLSLRSEIRQVAQELGAKVDDSRREFGVVTEGLRSEIQQVAEGVILNGERLDRFQAETAREFAEVRSMFRFSHAELERRLRTLEDSSESHETRLQRLESAASH